MSAGDEKVVGESQSRLRAISPDPELTAINIMMDSLADLDGDARSRVLAYIFGRLGVIQQIQQLPSQAAATRNNETAFTDIRSFASEKKPLTVIDRSAVVAFYLSEIAIEPERRRSIGQEEITRYFKQAGFPLPGSPSMALVHAKNAGFFELEGPGQYRLNAVGYNLVAHRMPKEGTERNAARRSKSAARTKTKGNGAKRLLLTGGTKK